jgi:hypothetical protein
MPSLRRSRHARRDRGQTSCVCNANATLSPFGWPPGSIRGPGRALRAALGGERGRTGLHALGPLVARGSSCRRVIARRRSLQPPQLRDDTALEPRVHRHGSLHRHRDPGRRSPGRARQTGGLWPVDGHREQRQQAASGGIGGLTRPTDMTAGVGGPDAPPAGTGRRSRSGPRLLSNPRRSGRRRRGHRAPPTRRSPPHRARPTIRRGRRASRCRRTCRSTARRRRGWHRA